MFMTVQPHRIIYPPEIKKTKLYRSTEYSMFSPLFKAAYEKTTEILCCTLYMFKGEKTDLRGFWNNELFGHHPDKTGVFVTSQRTDL